jgi:hypothetical protein
MTRFSETKLFLPDLTLHDWKKKKRGKSSFLPPPSVLLSAGKHQARSVVVLEMAPERCTAAVVQQLDITSAAMFGYEPLRLDSAVPVGGRMPEVVAAAGGRVVIVMACDEREDT